MFRRTQGGKRMCRVILLLASDALSTSPSVSHKITT